MGETTGEKQNIYWQVDHLNKEQVAAVRGNQTDRLREGERSGTEVAEEE